jgi:beta-glucosidase
LLDNFEWTYGYSQRFGLVRVDFASQRRTMKRSGLFYREVTRTNGEALGG